MDRVKRKKVGNRNPQQSCNDIIERSESMDEWISAVQRMQDYIQSYFDDSITLSQLPDMPYIFRGIISAVTHIHRIGSVGIYTPTHL